MVYERNIIRLLNFNISDFLSTFRPLIIYPPDPLSVHSYDSSLHSSISSSPLLLSYIIWDGDGRIMWLGCRSPSSHESASSQALYCRSPVCRGWSWMGTPGSAPVCYWKAWRKAGRLTGPLSCRIWWGTWPASLLDTWPAGLRCRWGLAMSAAPLASPHSSLCSPFSSSPPWCSAGAVGGRGQRRKHP